MKIIDLLNKIANGEIEDKRTFNIVFENGLQRSIYYDKDEKNCMECLKNVSDDYSIYDDISFDTEIATVDNFIEEEKKIPEKLPEWATSREDKEYTNDEYHCLVVARKVDEIIDYLKSKGE